MQSTGRSGNMEYCIAVILTLFASRAFFIFLYYKTAAGIAPVREQLATGGRVGVQIEIFSGVNSRPVTHGAKHTLGLDGHFICRRDVSYNGKNTKLTIKHFPSKPGGHFLEVRRAFFCPRAAGVRNPAVYLCM